MQAGPGSSSFASPEAASTDELVRAIRDGRIDPEFRPALELGPTILRHLVRARLVSARMSALQRSGRVGSHARSIGHEAVIVAAALAAPEDWLFPGAREWYAALARGMSLATYVHHAFGSAEDPAKGHACPDHAPGRAFRVVPPSGVLGAHLAQAVGAAWAARIKKERAAVLALFGAEVTDSGDFHNAMNFAGVFKAPVVLVCRSAPSRRVADRALAYGLASARVDGSDALAVLTVVRAARARAAEGKGATLVEAICATPAELPQLDDAPLAAGSALDLGPDDPVGVLREALVREGRIDPAAQDETAGAVSAELDAGVAAAERAGAPCRETIFEDVYARVAAHLSAQGRTLTRDPVGG